MGHEWGSLFLASGWWTWLLWPSALTTVKIVLLSLCSVMGRNKSRAKQRAIEEKAKHSSALALIASLSPALHAEVKANSIRIQVVPYHSREDLEAKGFVVNGSHFADFDSFRVDGNPSFIRPDLVFKQPTICVSCAETSPGSGQFDATLELVYWPNLTE